MSEKMKFDFNNNLKFLIESKKIDDIEKRITEQNEILNSGSFNESFNCIEDTLNHLYEKFRTFQDLIEYSDIFLKNEINDALSECKTILSSIENNRDLLKESAYIKYDVPFISGVNSATDRNSSIISSSSLYNEHITLSDQLVNQAQIKDIVISTVNNTNNLKNTKEDLLLKKPYRTLYVFDRPQNKEVEEKIIFTLTKPMQINKVTFASSNCEVKSIEYLLEDGSIEIAENNSIGLTQSRIVKSIIVNLSCSNYIVSDININKIQDGDFWNLYSRIKESKSEYIDNKKYYYYIFGIDNFKAEFVKVNNNSSFISKDIFINGINNTEYLKLEAEYDCQNGSVEFYVLDGIAQIPVLPDNVSQVIDEKLFYGMPTRFTVDNNKSIVIKRNSIVTKMTMNEAINKNDAAYTASYYPLNAQIIKNITSNNIKIKAIIRTYDKTIPYIKKIKLKKFGGGALWIDNMKM